MKEKGAVGKQKIDWWLMNISLIIIGVLVVCLTLYPEKGKMVANEIMRVLTHTFGSFTQLFTIIAFSGLIAFCFTKYGDIRLGNEKPKYSTLSWVAMMFFCGNGAGTVYWAFLEWGYHFNAAPQLKGSVISEAYSYELSMAYTFFDWGPSAWALLCVFTIPFAYHYYIKKDDELRLSVLCKYCLGEKLVKGPIGKIIDFIFIFAAIGSISITAGASASTIASAIASLLGISNSFALSLIVLLGVAVLYSLSSLLGIEKGMKRISDYNVYLCIFLLAYIFLLGPTKYIFDSIVNSLGILFSDYIRISLWTDPVAKTGYPQDWTAFYLIYWIVFGPFTGLFVAKISGGRKIKELIVNMILSGSAGLILFFGIIGGYQQVLKQGGILDVPKMLATGRAEDIAMSTINTLPFPKIMLIVYLLVIILFLATTLDACSFTLSSTVTKNISVDGEPDKKLKFIWCIVLVLIPIAISYIGTDINTIKSIVLATGLPLIVICIVVYIGFLRELFKDYKEKSKQEILDSGKF